MKELHLAGLGALLAPSALRQLVIKRAEREGLFIVDRFDVSPPLVSASDNK